MLLSIAIAACMLVVTTAIHAGGTDIRRLHTTPERR